METSHAGGRGLLVLLLAGLAEAAVGQDYVDSLHSPHALAMRLRSKVSDLVTLPLENDLQFGVGPASATSNTLNIQPIIPFPISQQWRIVTRTIIPFEYEDPAGEKGEPGRSGVAMGGGAGRQYSNQFGHLIRIWEMGGRACPCGSETKGGTQL